MRDATGRGSPLCYHTHGNSGASRKGLHVSHDSEIPRLRKRWNRWRQAIDRASGDNAPATGYRLEGKRIQVQIHGDNWIVILFMVVIAGFMGMLLLTLNQIVAPAKPNAIKSMPYESGIPDVRPVVPRYTPRFYVVAMLFVVFDLEVVFIYPWAVSFDHLGLFGFVDMLIFLGLLMIGYVYAWKKGALEWV